MRHRHLERRIPAVAFLLLAAVAAAAASAPLLSAPAVAADGPCAAPTISGTVEDDELVGTDGPDVIDGLAGDDVITGLGGDDVLCGGAGADDLDGGPGDDQLHGQIDGKELIDTGVFDYYGDTLAGGPGDDLLDPGRDLRREGTGDALSHLHSATGVAVDLRTGSATGEGVDQLLGAFASVYGSNHDDVLVGTDEPEYLDGYGGHDDIDGGGGDDYLAAGTPFGVDAIELPENSGGVLVGGPGDDMLQGSEGDDVLRAGSGRDVIESVGGLDSVLAGPGSDAVGIAVPPGADGPLLSGGRGTDDLSLYRAQGQQHTYRDAVVHVDLGAGTARARSASEIFRVEIPGFESISATYGKRWFIRGTDGPDSMFASGKVPIVAQGLGGNDRFYGSARHDVLDGGPGHDVVTSTPGRDRHVSVERIRS